ncbi:acetate/propionate family kinase [Novosphingobium mangrovi (ex Huang et al. 2023)]|uniref:Acetate kinase n=1 Tax=Novosphingobium mangrovi (ex Huang et al. 2023) TaxID=2976432 RepID=A0ABT2I7E8_9SPHN|nr:acetate/propionate family kinase [Novosphingobium mangrovi (ex Huang et al. 2023)]MCT2400739.1 acetate/propionate family kinase [Novosphingobium mangrovi (ex Huang et al. 2023)]
MKAIVSLNSGSSSIKFALFTLDHEHVPTLSAGGKIERIGLSPCLAIRDAHGTVLHEEDWTDRADMTHADLLEWLFDWALSHLEGREVIAIGHRAVHGGTGFARPCRIDDTVLAALEKLCPLAPLHQPHNLAAIRAIARIAPDLTQVACFDTAFHHDRPAVATRFAIPRALHDQGIRRYGFHGLSYEYIARRLAELDPELAAGKVIAAHLGNGASLCAMADGKSVDTTMGFTALDGLVMGTRCGAIDPGVILHLETQLGMASEEVEHLLYKESGLLGVSGLSSDMRTLSASERPEAEEAVDLFAWRAAREAGGLTASMGGIDGIVFTAGIGENHAGVRSRICKRLEWLGIELDEAANTANAAVISAVGSRAKVMVIPTDEERMIALHTLSVLSGTAP